MAHLCFGMVGQSKSPYPYPALGLWRNHLLGMGCSVMPPSVRAAFCRCFWRAPRAVHLLPLTRLCSTASVCSIGEASSIPYFCPPEAAQADLKTALHWYGMCPPAFPYALAGAHLRSTLLFSPLNDPDSPLCAADCHQQKASRLRLTATGNCHRLAANRRLLTAKLPSIQRQLPSVNHQRLSINRQPPSSHLRDHKYQRQNFFFRFLRTPLCPCR